MGPSGEGCVRRFSETQKRTVCGRRMAVDNPGRPRPLDHIVEPARCPRRAMRHRPKHDCKDHPRDTLRRRGVALARRQRRFFRQSIPPASAFVSACQGLLPAFPSVISARASVDSRLPSEATVDLSGSLICAPASLLASLTVTDRDGDVRILPRARPRHQRAAPT